MGLTGKLFGKERDASLPHSGTRAGEEPQNPLAPKPRESDDSPASFTPMQLGPSSAHSSGTDSSIADSHSTEADQIRDMKAEVLANWLHNKQEERVWTFGAAGEGVFMKKARGSYSCAPLAIRTDGTGLYEAVTELNVRVSRGNANIFISLLLNMYSAL
jgi:hypothetical protein